MRCMDDQATQWSYQEVKIVHDQTIPATAKRNVEASFARNLPRFQKMRGLGNATGPVAIVGGGPSLRDQLKNLGSYPGVIVACGTVHDYLIENGVIPRCLIVGDPDADGVTLRWLRYPQKRTTYLVASHCPVAVFDALTGYDVRMWHLDVGEGEGAPDFRGEPAVPGGHFTVARAWVLAAIMGFREIDFFGFDCSFPKDCTGQHAYAYEWTCEEPVTAKFQDKEFITTPGLLSQLQGFIQQLHRSANRFSIRVHGKSLASSVVNHCDVDIGNAKVNDMVHEALRGMVV